MKRVGWLLAVGLCLPSLAWAKAQPGPLTVLPRDKLGQLAPLLRAADLALLEQTDKGRIKQLTTLSLAAAPPDAVREVVAHPERYPDFIRNMDYSTVKPGPDGTLDHAYKITYKFESVDGRHRYVFLPPGPPGSGAAPIEMFDPDDNGVRHYRWEFLPAGGGTLIVLYGYTQIPQSGLYVDLMRAAPTLEFGLGLIPQLTLLLAVKSRAEELNGRKSVAPPTGTPNFNFLLERGTVAIFRTREGVLSEVTMLDNIAATAPVALQVVADARKWKEFVPSITASIDLGMVQGNPGVELEQSLPLLSWNTKYSLRVTPTSVDMLGVDGDLRLARLRWDAAPLPGGRTQIVLRTDEAFERTSMVLRQLYKMEPLLKYGVNVGLGLVVLKGVESRAIALSLQHATR